MLAPFCIKSHLPCPLNDIKIISSDVNMIPPNYTVLPLTSKYNIIYSSTSFLPPILNFKLSEHIPCISELEHGHTPGRVVYPLFILDHESWGCKSSFSEALKYDPWYVFIDKISEEELYKQNSLNLSVLPSFDSYLGKKAMYSLY